jgi:hypothetical protein
MHQRTGLYVSDMEWLYEQCKASLLQLRLHKRSRKENCPPISPHNMLLITVYWLRRYPPFTELASVCGETVSNVWRVVRDVVQVMDECIVNQLIRPIDTTSPISTRATLPNVRILVDTTFIPLPRTPFNPKLYHQKSPTKSAWKFEIACDLSHRIVNVSDAYPGSTHDMRIIRESRLLQQQSDTSRIVGDKGYEGKLGIITPQKKKRKASKELAGLEDERIKRHELETERAAIENINKRVKEWEIISGQYRGGYSFHSFIDAVIRVVCALTNRIFMEHPIREKV